MPRKKKTKEEKMQIGTYRKDREEPLAPIASTVSHVRRAPAGMPEPAATLWRVTCKSLNEAGVLIELAYPQIENYCLQYFIWNKHKDLLFTMDTPGTEDFSNGNRGGNKDHEAVNKARKQMEKFEADWALTPAAGMAISNSGDDNEFDL